MTNEEAEFGRYMETELFSACLGNDFFFFLGIILLIYMMKMKFLLMTG